MDDEALKLADRTVPGDILQIKPEFDPDGFGGCLLVVLEHNGWKAYGYLTGFGQFSGPEWYVAVPFDHCAHTGGRVQYPTSRLGSFTWQAPMST